MTFVYTIYGAIYFRCHYQQCCYYKITCNQLGNILSAVWNHRSCLTVNYQNIRENMTVHYVNFTSITLVADVINGRYKFCILHNSGC